MYSLRYEGDVATVWDSLPDAARAEFDRAIFAVCEDPYATTAPYATDGDVKRLLVLDHSVAVLVIFKHPLLRVRVLELKYLD
ncbi:hypothetical protein ACWELB_21045 [Streptomyces asiaticus]